MNPLLLAAIVAVPAAAYPVPAETGRAVVFRVRVLTTHNDLPDGITVQPGGSAVTDAQLKALVEAAQFDRRGQVFAAPTVTAVEGQTASVLVGGNRTFTTGVEARQKGGEVVLVPRTKTVEVGTRLELTGRVAAGGKAVAARVKYTNTQVDDAVPGVPLTLSHGKPARVGITVLEAPVVDTVRVEAALDVPAGGSVVIPGPARMVEYREVYETPVLSRIPYVSRLFRNVGVGREVVRTYLVVTAEVVEGQ